MSFQKKQAYDESEDILLMCTIKMLSIGFRSMMYTGTPYLDIPKQDITGGQAKNTDKYLHFCNPFFKTCRELSCNLTLNRLIVCF